VRLHAFGKRNLTAELPITTFGTVHALFTLFVFILALTFNQDGIVSNVDFYIVLGQTWKIGANDEFPIALEYIDLQRELFGATPRAEPLQARKAKAFKHSIHLICKPAHHAERTSRGPVFHSGKRSAPARLNSLILFPIFRTF